MRKIGFVGVYDKTDLILCIAKVLACVGKKVCILDATTTQKCKYVVPVLNPTRSYITNFDDIDVAVGFENMEELRQYLGLENDEPIDYDIILIDVDDYEAFTNFDLANSDKLYYSTSFDLYSLKKGIQLLKEINKPLKMTKIYFSKEMLDEEEQYFDYLTLGLRIVWTQEKVGFFLENGDQAALIENQRVEKIKLKNMSNVYRENIEFIVNLIDNTIGKKKIKDVIKNL